MSNDTMERLLEDALESIRIGRHLIRCMTWLRGHPMAGEDLSWDEKAAEVQERCRALGIIAHGELG